MELIYTPKADLVYLYCKYTWEVPMSVVWGMIWFFEKQYGYWYGEGPDMNEEGDE